MLPALFLQVVVTREVAVGMTEAAVVVGAAGAAMMVGTSMLLAGQQQMAATAAADDSCACMCCTIAPGQPSWVFSWEPWVLTGMVLCRTQGAAPAYACSNGSSHQPLLLLSLLPAHTSPTCDLR
jgi:hypothetical protein